MDPVRERLQAARVIIDLALAHVPLTSHPEGYCAAGLAEAHKQVLGAAVALEALLRE